MKKIFLVTVLIEISDESPIDGHRAFTDYSKAKQAMSEEIENAQSISKAGMERCWLTLRTVKSGVMKMDTAIPLALKS